MEETLVYKKILLIISISLYINGQHILAIIVFIIGLTSILKEGIIKTLDSYIESMVKHIGCLIIKFIICVLYIFLIIPSRLFIGKVKSSDDTEFIKMNKSKINFDRPW